MWWTWLIPIPAIAGVLAIIIAVRPRFLTRGPRGEVGYTLFWYSVHAFGRLVHHVKLVNMKCVPSSATSVPLLVVSNHTGGVDPVLISGVVPFHVRWMMAKNTMSRDAAWFWKWMETIPVTRDGNDTVALREAIRHIKGGGAIGIFPEGGIVKPPGEIRPFIDGVGLLVTRTKAPVLLAWISGTRFSSSSFGSVLKPSHARIEFAGPFDFSHERDPRAITRALRATLQEMSGWPLNDDLLPSARGGGGSGSGGEE